MFVKSIELKMFHSSGISLIVLLVLFFEPAHLYQSSDLTGPEIFDGGIATPGLIPYQCLVSVHGNYKDTKDYGRPYPQSGYGQPNYQPPMYNPNIPIAFCVGVILNQNFLLVPGNCTLNDQGKSRPLSDYRIRCGYDSLSDDEKTKSTVYLVDEVILDPDYKVTDPNGENNLALLRTSIPIRYTPYVKRACINLSTDRFPTLFTSAYGKIPELDRYRNYLKYAFTVESPRSSCDPKEICASPSTDAPLLSCPARYGGLIQTFSYDVVGLLAWSYNGTDSCQKRDTYIRISSYQDFLDDNLSPRGWCKVHC